MMNDWLQLNSKELETAFSDPAWAAKYPPVLTLNQAAELIQVPLQTLYSWRSRGLLNGCSRKVGKHVRVFRDRFLHHIFNKGLTP